MPGIPRKIRTTSRVESGCRRRAAGRKLGAGIVLGAAITAGAATLGFAAPRASTSATCFGKAATMLGTPRSDVIKGTHGRDVIVSFGGHDNVLSRQGDDYVCSGPGDDVIHGAEGFNRMNGGGGDDWIDGRRGRGNVVIAGRGADHVEAEGRLEGDAGGDIIESYGYKDPSLSPVPDITDGGPGNDDIYGCGGTTAPERPSKAPGPPKEQSWAWPDCYGPPRDGRPSADLLGGGADDDRVFGGGRNDKLQGGDGNDRLYGEDGNDDLDGGGGNDTCDQNAGTGTTTGCP